MHITVDRYLNADCTGALIFDYVIACEIYKCCYRKEEV